VNKEYVIQNSSGMKATLSSFGARLVELMVLDNCGKLSNVVLGFDTHDEYLNNVNTYFQFSHSATTYYWVINGVGKAELNSAGTMNATAFTPYSDDRVKTNEVFITNATETILKLRPQKYHKYETLDCSGNYVVESGLIAQEIYYDAPELRHIVSLPNDATPLENIPSSTDPSIDPDYSSWGSTPAAVNYNGLIPYLIQTIKELNARILVLENN
jgi:hypothetical protein